MVKKVLFFTGGSYVAGLEIVTLLLIKGLKEKGHDVRCVVNGWNDGDFKNRLSKMGVPYYEVKLGWLYLTKPVWTLDTIINYPKAFFACRKVLKEFKPDAINFSSYAIPIMIYPLIKGKAFFTLHDTHQPTFKHRVIYSLLKRKIGVFVAVSNHIAAALKKLTIPAAKIIVIHNGVALPRQKEEKLPAQGTICFGIIGQVVETKGHSVLIEAARMLVKKGISDFRIVIAGNNATAFGAALPALIEEKGLASFIEWAGYIKDTEEIYRGVDVVVVPSLCIESFSLTTAEAMIRGLAVIASGSGGMAELIENEKDGLLFTPGSAAGLCNCMEKIIAARAYATTLGRTARQKAAANFTDVAMTDKYIAAYSQYAAGNPHE